ncbi:MAG TPA: M3 family oligoendopeptidase [Armatimonadota bacterium]|nr:M3 family oligoendopeptidase [Armatimonadota bacterium]
MATTPQVTWNLSDLYSGVDDPKITQDLDTLETRANAFAQQYRDKIVRLSPHDFGKALVEYEGILHDMQFPGAYAELIFSADSLTPANGALMQSVQERSVAIQQHLLFFELEMIAIPDEQFATVLTDPTVAAYRHYLEHERAARPHRLSEPEERILLEKSTTGRDAFSRLFDESIADAVFSMTVNGETSTMTESEILSKFYDPDRTVRRAASEGLTEGLKQRARLFTFITNTLAYDKSVDDRLTHFDNPEAARHLADEVDTDIVHTMIDTVADHFGTVARYYRLKRGILGLDTLYHYDRYAPIIEDETTVAWDDAKQTVLDAYRQFSPTMSDMATRFFDERWIDAEVRKGKRGGAFCAGIAPDWHPYVLTNFLGKKRDIMTLAHELGHGVHDLLAAGQKFLQYYPSLAAAETASVFGEMLTFNAVLAGTTDPKQRLSLLTGKIEDIFATVFRQTAMYRFEQGLHTARREQGELTTDTINEIWQQNLQAMFGDSVIMGEGHEVWWMYIPHFIHTPFYVYAYAFGQLLVMALYARYQQEGESFVPHYLDILRAGGSESPAAIMAAAGIDISQRSFWEGGLKMIDDLVAQAEDARQKTE